MLGLAFRVVKPLRPGPGTNMGGPGCKGGNPLRTRFLVCAGGAGGGRPDRDALDGRGVVDR